LYARVSSSGFIISARIDFSTLSLASVVPFRFLLHALC
jgi:hypothetical protein